MFKKLFLLIFLMLCLPVLSVFSDNTIEKSKINNKSVFSRTPRRGYRPEDISGLDENTKAEIEAIKQLCLTYTKSMSVLDFRKAWDCHLDGRASYDRFLKSGYVRKAEKEEFVRKWWASLKVMKIIISTDEATADLCREVEAENKMIFILKKAENQWKIRNMIYTDTLNFDEDKLPSFYFEEDKN